MNVVNQWYEAIICELVVCGIYSREHDNNPRKALNDLMCWHASVALDPLVSSEAQQLVERGRREGCSCCKDDWK